MRISLSQWPGKQGIMRYNIRQTSLPKDPAKTKEDNLELGQGKIQKLGFLSYLKSSHHICKVHMRYIYMTKEGGGSDLSIRDSFSKVPTRVKSCSKQSLLSKSTYSVNYCFLPSLLNYALMETSASGTSLVLFPSFVPTNVLPGFRGVGFQP